MKYSFHINGLTPSSQRRWNPIMDLVALWNVHSVEHSVLLISNGNGIDFVPKQASWTISAQLVVEEFCAASNFPKRNRKIVGCWQIISDFIAECTQKSWL